MAFVTTNLGLNAWDQLSDTFSRTELADNWTAVDEHDHTVGKGVQIPTDGLANLSVTGPKLAADSVDSSKLTANAVGNSEIQDAAVGPSKLQDGSVIATKVPGPVAEAKLASPNNAVWRPVFHDVAAINSATNTAAGVYVFHNGGLVLNGNTVDVRFMRLWRVPATSGGVVSDVNVPGLTTKIRIRIVGAANGLSTGVTYTVKLYPITAIASGSNLMNLQALDLPKITGPALVITGGWWPAVSSAVDLGTVTSDYAFGVQTNAATPANAVLSINAYVEMQHS